MLYCRMTDFGAWWKCGVQTAGSVWQNSSVVQTFSASNVGRDSLTQNLWKGRGLWRQADLNDIFSVALEYDWLWLLSGTTTLCLQKSSTLHLAP